jgi:hypothetical protein
MKNLVLMIVPALICGMAFTSCGFRETKTTADRTYWKYSELIGKGKVKIYYQTVYKAITDWEGQLSKGEILRKVSIEYTESGLWTEYNSSRPDGSDSTREVITWDDDGNSLERRDYYFGVLGRRYVFTNDNRGNLIETRRYNASDSLTSVIVYLYDKNDNHIERRTYNGVEVLMSKRIDKYDKNKRISESTYHADGTLNFVLFFDNSEKRIERNDYDHTGNMIVKVAYQHNDKGFLSEMITYNLVDNTNQRTIYKYKYDFNDNWIEKIEFVNDVATEIIERQIEYYE